MKRYSRQSSTERGYTWQWAKASKAYRDNNPLCVMCLKLGIVTASQVTDHIIPHKGNNQLFWDESNWQALCKHCHDNYKQVQEKSGYLKGNDINGLPLDPNHSWNK